MAHEKPRHLDDRHSDRVLVGNESPWSKRWDLWSMLGRIDQSEIVPKIDVVVERDRPKPLVIALGIAVDELSARTACSYREHVEPDQRDQVESQQRGQERRAHGCSDWWR